VSISPAPRDGTDPANTPYFGGVLERWSAEHGTDTQEGVAQIGALWQEAASNRPSAKPLTRH
jgi:hypothetical protein